MRLYYAPGACSLAPHIILRETGLPFTLTRVDTGKHQLEDGSDYYAIAPKGQVPLLELDDGVRISEGPVISQYIADRASAEQLLPRAGSLERIRVLEWCNHLTSEIHKSFTPIFHQLVEPASIDKLKAVLKKKLAFLDRHLGTQPYLCGEQFTIADAYLFVLLSWTTPIRLDVSDLKHLAAFRSQIAARPSTREAMRAEGLIA